MNRRTLVAVGLAIMEDQADQLGTHRSGDRGRVVVRSSTETADWMAHRTGSTPWKDKSVQCVEPHETCLMTERIHSSDPEQAQIHATWSSNSPEVMMKIRPYQSVGEVVFGETKADCIRKLGLPQANGVNRDGVEELKYPQMVVRLDPIQKRVVEVTLLPYWNGTIEGIQVAWDRPFLSTLCLLDGEPRAVYGFIVLSRLGVAITGIHDADTAQLAMTVFPRGAFDELLKFGVPYVCG